jgi:hypothetical protein
MILLQILSSQNRFASATGQQLRAARIFPRGRGPNPPFQPLGTLPLAPVARRERLHRSRRQLQQIIDVYSAMAASCVIVGELVYLELDLSGILEPGVAELRIAIPVHP